MVVVAGWPPCTVVLVASRVGPSGLVGRGSGPDDRECGTAQHGEHSDAHGETTPEIGARALRSPSVGRARGSRGCSSYHGCGVMTGGRWNTAKKSLVLEYKKRFEI